jgi:hypothetical protein
MDCLDRTNVVQSVISRLVAHKQLHKMNILNKPVGDPFERFPQKFEDLFRQSWTNNANVVSILYSGTPALKTDFTLTGKRTMQGAIQDGINSTKRYYINNFCDLYNQDVLDSTMMKMKPGKAVNRKGLPKFLALVASIVVGVTVFNAIIKYFLGVHSMTPEDPEYYDYGYTIAFVHLVCVFGAVGLVAKKVFLK